MPQLGRSHLLSATAEGQHILFTKFCYDSTRHQTNGDSNIRPPFPGGDVKGAMRM